MGTAVLASAASLSCVHQGKAVPATTTGRLTVAGRGVLLLGMESGLDFAACTNQTTSSPPAAAPCVSDAAVSGAATRLTVGGTPVLLASAGGATHPKLTPAAVGTWSVASAGQNRLTSV